MHDKNWEYLSVTSPRLLCGRLGSAPAGCRCNEAPNRGWADACTTPMMSHRVVIGYGALPAGDGRL